jgi:hypothetical protein
MNKNPEFFLIIAFFTMAEIMIVLGIIGKTYELFGLAALYAFPIWICFVSMNQKLKSGK